MGQKGGGRGIDRKQLGDYWLWWRKERNQWFICWYDAGADGRGRRTRRLATGVTGGSAGSPPRAAEEALAAHLLTAIPAAARQAPSAALVENILAEWLETHAIPELSDAARYATSIAHWQRFFAEERRAGRLRSAPVVDDLTPTLMDRFITWRKVQHVGLHTISRDLAALRQPVNWMWKNHRLESAPFIKDVGKKPKARSLVYDAQEIAALLDAAWADPQRHHVHLFAMIMLSTHGRGEAVLELEAEQLRDGLIHFNPDGRDQTSKFRSIVPIAPTLAPWLEKARGRVIQWQKPRRGPEGEETVYTRQPVTSIKKAFATTLRHAGLVDSVTSSAAETKLVPRGSPNTLRHTISTEMHRRGVPQAQIEAAAGHGGETTNERHYRHLRPGYLSDFIDGVEDFWRKVDEFTSVHRCPEDLKP